MRHRELALFAEHPMMVFGHRHGQRRPLVLPVRNQLIERDRIDHRARQDVGADLASLFENAHRKLTLGLIGQLLEADRRAQPGGAGADDDHVIGHGFALHILPWRRRAEPLVASATRSAFASPANSLTAPSMAVRNDQREKAWAGNFNRSAWPRRATHWRGGSKRASTSPFRTKPAIGSTAAPPKPQAAATGATPECRRAEP